MRVCIGYDCLYPHTVGGAERWYRALAERLAADGHDVTYLTRRQWPAGEAPDAPLGVRVITVAPGGPLYSAGGRRRIGPPLRFGMGVLRHLANHRDAYDAVHLCAFPYFSVLAARVALAGTGTPLAVDWFEVWTRAYWTSYLGPVGGLLGFAIQRACVRATRRAFVFSDLHADRLAAEGVPGDVVRLAGLYDGPRDGAALCGPPDHPVVVYAGRHIPEKRVELIPGAIAVARQELPNLHAMILGDGPQRTQVLAAIAAAGLDGCVDAPGFVDHDEVQAALAGASCLVLPSSREGYGLVVIEAAAAGTPSVVVAGQDNAATELIQPGRNGVVAPSADPQDLAAAIQACVAGGSALRAATAAWFAEHAGELTLDASLERVLESYSGAGGG